MGGMMAWSFRIFPVFGIPVRMHLFMAIMIVAWLLSALMMRGPLNFGYTAVSVSILIFIILFHELAHCWMAIRLGGSAHEIMLWPLGGLATVDHSTGPRGQIKVSAIGPLSNFFLFGVGIGVLLLTGAPWSWDFLNPFESWSYGSFPGTTIAQDFLVHFVRINLILGLFNLVIPAYPLDGGQILFSFLTIRQGRRRAAEATATIGIISGIAMAVWGLMGEQFFLLIIGVMVIFSSYQLKQLLRWGEIEAHPMVSSQPEYDYMPHEEKPKRPGFFRRWRQKRARKRMRVESMKETEFQGKVDAVLEKVGREGMQSLTPSEKKILDEASRRSRRE